MDNLAELKRLAKTIADAENQRNTLIVETRRSGHTWEVISAAIGQPRSTTILWARNANDGKLPKPRE